jgi:hypothetical protein
MSLRYPFHNHEEGKRRAHDFYRTRAKFVEASLLKLRLLFPSYAFNRVLDPGAGEGVWGLVGKSMWPTSKWFGVEPQDLIKPSSYDGWIDADFLTATRQWGGNFDAAIGNPPYSLAQEFVLKSLDMTSDKGIVAFVLRLSFLETLERGLMLWRGATPLMYVCPSLNRVPFESDSQTDAYALFIWKKDYDGKPLIDWMTWDDEKKHNPVYDILFDWIKQLWPGEGTRVTKHF